jgi:hypothetical protein
VLLLEVEIVLQDLVSSLGRANRSEDDLHVKLSPSSLLDRERRILESCTIMSAFVSSITCLALRIMLLLALSISW